MRDKNAPRGKVFRFKRESEWGNEIAQQVHLSPLYRSHMVVVLGKALERPPGWVRIVTVCVYSTHTSELFQFDQVTSTLPTTFDPNYHQHYLPICPTRKLQKGGVQLKLCGSFEQQTTLRLLSYVRIDKVEEVPLEVLSEIPRSDGLGVMLQEKSFHTLQNCLRT
jgi:hypothetical protein